MLGLDGLPVSPCSGIILRQGRTAGPAAQKRQERAREREAADKKAAEVKAAEDARSPRDDAGTGSDPLAEVVTSGTGTDADAGEYLNEDQA